jgi:hypothetical protein
VLQLTLERLSEPRVVVDSGLTERNLVAVDSGVT